MTPIPLSPHQLELVRAIADCWRTERRGPRLMDLAARFGVTHDELVSPRRSQAVAYPRQVAMYLAKTLTLRSLPEIGRRFGGRDHTTVLHAVRKIEALVARDTALSEEVESLKRQLQE